MTTRRSTISIAVFTTLLILMFSLPVFTVMAQSSSGKTDCSYFLAVLDDVLDNAVKGDRVGEFKAKVLLNTSLPPELRSLHVYTYRTILDYYDLMENVEINSSSLVPLKELLLTLPKISEYASKLASCSHDSEAAKTYLVRIEFKLNDIKTMLEKYMETTIKRLQVVTLNPSRESYEPGSRIQVFIPVDFPVEAVLISAWPSLTILKYADRIYQLGEYQVYEVLTPSAIEVEENPVLRSDTSRSKIYAIVLKLHNNTYIVGDFIKVEYRDPQVYINMPHTIKRNSVLVVNVSSDQFYNYTMLVNKAVISEGVLKPGFNEFYIDLSSLNVSTGYSTLNLCVNASIKTRSRCYQAAFIVEANPPRVDIALPRISLSILGFTELTISNQGDTDIYVKVTTGFDSRVVEITRDQVVKVRILASVLPVWSTHVAVEVYPTMSQYDAYVKTLDVIVVNVFSLIALISIAMIIPLYAGVEEKSFMFSIAFMWSSSSRERFSRLLRQAKSTTATYVLGLGSRIAMLYYQLLRKLGFRLPEPSETLREHFSSTLGTVKHRLRFVDSAWKLLLLVEKDLYSTRKPRYEEALDLYKGALDAARED